MTWAVDSAEFWASPIGEGLAFIGAIMGTVAVIAAGWKGASYLMREFGKTTKAGLARIRENQRVDKVIEDLASTKGWPNGSNSPKESHRSLYAKVSDIESTQQEVLLRVTELQTAVERVLTNKDKE